MFWVTYPTGDQNRVVYVKLDQKTLKEIEYFFVSYNKLSGKKFKLRGKGGPKKALKLVTESQSK